MQLAIQSSGKTFSHQETHHWLVIIETRNAVQKRSKAQALPGKGAEWDMRDTFLRIQAAISDFGHRFWAQEGKKEDSKQKQF